jgi:N-acetylglucosamine kinase-like BadF-type ATPase
MILIADSGSSKTSWVLMDLNRQVAGQCQTAGINPFFQTEAAILHTLETEFSLPVNGLDTLCFYGAGCANPEKKELVQRALSRAWNPAEILIDSDLMAAARSLCGNQAGVAAILGTGSNSCYYDGVHIAQQVSPLGYILGDEGGGAVLGKKLVADVLKHQLPAHICELFFESNHLTPADILDRIYKQPFPNRFLAQFTKFILHHLNEASLYRLVKTSFMEFFDRNIRQYPQAKTMPVHFTGSVAWHFQAPLREAANATGHTVGCVTKDPMEGLIQYHSNL